MVLDGIEECSPRRRLKETGGSLWLPCEPQGRIQSACSPPDSADRITTQLGRFRFPPPPLRRCCTRQLTIRQITQRPNRPLHAGGWLRFWPQPSPPPGISRMIRNGMTTQAPPYAKGLPAAVAQLAEDAGLGGRGVRSTSNSRVMLDTRDQRTIALPPGGRPAPTIPANTTHAQQTRSWPHRPQRT